MPDENNKLVPGSKAPHNITQSSTGKKIALPGLHNRLKKAEAQTNAINPATMANRIALMLDVSESMHGNSISKLKDAVQGFITSTDFTTTALSMDTFPERQRSLPLTNQSPLLLMTALGLVAGGGTPMAECMDKVLNTLSITRGVLVSDGDATGRSPIETAHDYANAGIPVDCVHIGESSNGEDTLKKIAEITGGIYIKFTDVSSFGKAFRYLTPAFRAMLTSGTVTAEQIGAKELKA